MGCPDSGKGPNCSWKRKLCVTCSTSGGSTYIRVQTNSMPDHCYGGGPPVVTTQEIDFTVLFNKSPDTNT
jgi:hypothetical protein